MSRIEPPEYMRQFGKADGRMVADAICQQFIDGVWRAPLQNVEINTGVKNQRAADKRFVRCPGKLGICSSRQPL